MNNLRGCCYDEFAVDSATFLMQTASCINKTKTDAIVADIKHAKLPEDERNKRRSIKGCQGLPMDLRMSLKSAAGICCAIDLREMRL